MSNSPLRSTSNPPLVDEFNDLLSDLKSSGKSINKETRDRHKDLLNKIFDKTRLNGCTPKDLINAFSLITSGQLNTYVAVKLISFLYPLLSIPPKVVILITGSLGLISKRVDTKVQASCIQWLITCLDWLDDDARRKLNSFYGIYWLNLNVESLRPHITQIISLLTRREHVKPFRVNYLINLQSKYPLDPSLPQLITTFKTFYPDKIPQNLGLTAGRRPYKVNIIWKNHAIAIRQGRIEEHLEILANEQAEREQQQQDPDSRIPKIADRISKRQRIDYDIPSLTTVMTNSNSLTLSDIPTLHLLAKNLDKVTLPAQISSALKSKYLTWALISNPQPENINRLESWIINSLYDLTLDDCQDENKIIVIQSLLKKVCEFLRYTKILTPQLELFIEDFIASWDGTFYSKEVFELISYYPPRTFEKLYISIIAPLTRISSIKGHEFRLNILNCFKNLMYRWSSFNWENLRHEKKGFGNVLTYLETDVNWLNVIAQLNSYTEQLCFLVLSEKPYSIQCHRTVLDSLHASMFLITISSEGNVILPSQQLMFSLLINGDLYTISRLCYLIVSWKQIVNEHDDLVKNGEAESYTEGFLNQFNKLVNGFLDHLWKQKAYDYKKENDWFGINKSLIEQLKNNVRSLPWENFNVNLRNLGDVAYSFSFAAMQIKYLEILQNERNIPKSERYYGPIAFQFLSEIDVEKLDKNVRPNYLKYLAENGAKGLRALLLTYVEGLTKLTQDPSFSPSFSKTLSQSISPNK